MNRIRIGLLIGIIGLIATCAFGQGTAMRSNNGSATNSTLVGGTVITDTTGAVFWEITNLINGADHDLIFQNASQGPLQLIGNRALASTFASNIFTGTIFGAGNQDLSPPGAPCFFALNNGTPGLQSTYGFNQAWNIFSAQDINNITFPFNEWVVNNPNTADTSTNETWYAGFNTDGTGHPINNALAAWHIKWHGNEALVNTNHLGILTLESVFPDNSTRIPLQLSMGIRPGDPQYKQAVYNFYFDQWSMAYGPLSTTNLFNFSPSPNTMNLVWASSGSLQWPDTAQNLIQFNGLGNLMDWTGSGNGARLQLFGYGSSPTATLLIENQARLIHTGQACFGTNNIITGGTNQVAVSTPFQQDAVDVATNGITYFKGPAVFMTGSSGANFSIWVTNGQPSNAQLGGNGSCALLISNNIPALIFATNNTVTSGRILTATP